jgi:predicted esterase
MDRRYLSRAAVLALLAGAIAPACGWAAGWPSFSGDGSGVFRAGTYVRGEWIFTNGLHQALGANTDGLHRPDYFRTAPAPEDKSNDVTNAVSYNFFGVGRGARNGDYQLPTDDKRFPDGTADLAEVRLVAGRTNLFVRFVWNAMPRPDAQMATLTFATAGAAAPAKPWPHGAQLSSAWQVALTHWGTGAALSAAAGGAERPVTARVGDHVTDARIPLSALPPGPWVLTGGAGLADPAAPGQYWAVPPGAPASDRPGSGAAEGTSSTSVWDLLFSDDEPWTFDEWHQSDELAAGTVEHATATVDPQLLRGGATRRPPPRTGDLSRMFISRLAGGDGIEKVPGLAGATGPPELAGANPGGGFETWLYHGRLQDYALHVPERYPGTPERQRWPLIVYLHGFGGNPDEAFYLPLGLVARADKEGYLLASVRGRGDSFYTGMGDLDVMEVLRDVRRHYRVDPDRIYLMGHSMGAYGTNNVATHHPDLFAGVVPAEGTSSPDLAGNLRNVPWYAIGADEDLDGMAAEATALYEKLSAAGLDATLLVYHMKIHEYSTIYDTLDRLFAFFGARRRDGRPATVSWTRRPKDDHPKLGLVYDGAYWLDRVTAADAEKPAIVTATSMAIPHRVRDPKAAKRTHTSIDTGGPSGRTTAELYETVPEAGTPAAQANDLGVEAVNAAAFTVDAERARLRLRARPLRVSVDADHAIRITLTRLGRRRMPVQIRVDGGPPTRAQVRNGRLAQSLPAGRHRFEIRRTVSQSS